MIEDKIIEFKQRQKATSLTEEQTKDEVLSIKRYKNLFEDFIFIDLPDIWVRIDLKEHTYSIGDYEG